MDIRPRRSALYVPGDNARAIEKSKDLPCDVIIFDLEDAVAPNAKAAARAAAVEAVRSGTFGYRERVIRVNALDTLWVGEDMAVAGAARPDALLVPKVGSAAEARKIVQQAGSVPVWVMIETPAGVLNAAEIAAVDGVTALVAGVNDLAKELRAIRGQTRQPLLYSLSHIVLAARSAGCTALDGVYNLLDDPIGLREECDQGVAMGFDGKTVIHPRQLAAANEAFAPDLTEVHEARELVAAFEKARRSGKGVATYRGGLVEALHVETARRLLAFADAVERIDR